MKFEYSCVTQYGGVPVSISGSAAYTGSKNITYENEVFTFCITVDGLYTIMIQSNLAIYQTAIQNDNASLASDISNLKNYGAPASLGATGTYSWSNLNGLVSGLNALPAKNSDCANVMNYWNGNFSGMFYNFTKALVVTLPIPYTSVAMLSNITCGPVNPVQTLPDQPAYFTAYFTVTTNYVMYAQSATYVTLSNPSVDTTLQYQENAAPLNLANVFAAANRAVYNLIVYSVRGSLGLFKDTLVLNGS